MYYMGTLNERYKNLMATLKKTLDKICMYGKKLTCNVNVYSLHPMSNKGGQKRQASPIDLNGLFGQFFLG